MSTLIRFEDKYGMADFYDICKGRMVASSDEYDRIIEVDDDVYVQRSLGIRGIFRLNVNDIGKIQQYNINKVIFVHDLDDINGDKSLLVNFHDIKETVLSFTRRFLQ